jgi:predicted RNase H-like nuclease
LEFALYPTIDNLVAANRGAERIFVDIPIGLPWSAVPTRPCDQLARSVLGKRRSSVFSPPCREALYAANVAEARRTNLAVLRRSLSEQAWGICPKIAEVDTLLSANPLWIGKIREIHPEVCFWALADRRPMEHNKGTRQGLEDRCEVLRRYEPQTKQLITRVLSATPRARVQADDVLDGLAALLTAEADDRNLARLIGTPATDQRGLVMEMVHLKC